MDLVTDLAIKFQTKSSSRARHKPHCAAEMPKIRGMKQDPAANHRVVGKHVQHVVNTVVKQTKTGQGKKPTIQDEVNG